MEETKVKVGVSVGASLTIMNSFNSQGADSRLSEDDEDPNKVGFVGGTLAGGANFLEGERRALSQFHGLQATVPLGEIKSDFKEWNLSVGYLGKFGLVENLLLTTEAGYTHIAEGDRHMAFISAGAEFASRHVARHTTPGESAYFAMCMGPLLARSLNTDEWFAGVGFKVTLNAIGE